MFRFRMALWSNTIKHMHERQQDQWAPCRWGDTNAFICMCVFMCVFLYRHVHALVSQQFVSSVRQLVKNRCCVCTRSVRRFLLPKQCHKTGMWLDDHDSCLLTKFLSCNLCLHFQHLNIAGILKILSKITRYIWRKMPVFYFDGHTGLCYIPLIDAKDT